MPVLTETTTVVIVGCGPAGVVLGLLLQREGIPFVLLERHDRSFLGGPPKAGVVEHRTVELLTVEGIAGPIVQFEAENGCCEFRTPDESVVFDYGTLTGGRPHFIYAQHLLVADLGAALEATGADIRFGTTVSSVEHDADGASVTVVGGDARSSVIEAEVVVGCDGSRSTIAPALDDATVVEESLPVRWLAVIAAAPPLVMHTVYAAHPHGFAGHMRRSPTQTRYYLEVPARDGLEDWPEARIRRELTERLRIGDQLEAVRFIEPTLLDLRMRVRAPMQQGRVFLVGDAAHLITPAGGKGMNLAIQDAVELAHGLVERFGPAGDGARLAAYSDTRLPVIWRTQAFSRWMLRLILSGSDGDSERSVAFGRGLKEGWVSALQEDPLLARWFAHAYAGADPR
jgi:p-hydroxybenzoate 3-monooxygenase